jgi:hypothetical protein
MSSFYAQKRRECTNKPNVGVRVHVCHVIIQVLETENDHHDQLELHRAYRANRVEQTLFYQTLLQATLITFPSSSMTIADRRPCRPDLGTAAGKEQIIVEFVLLPRRSLAACYPRPGGSFDRNDDGRVVGRHENVASESILIRFPPVGAGLRKTGISGAET